MSWVSKWPLPALRLVSASKTLTRCSTGPSEEERPRQIEAEVVAVQDAARVVDIDERGEKLEIVVVEAPARHTRAPGELLVDEPARRVVERGREAERQPTSLENVEACLVE